jgi:hypothetical protein
MRPKTKLESSEGDGIDDAVEAIEKPVRGRAQANDVQDD